jgi:hypothetical protein
MGLRFGTSRITSIAVSLVALATACGAGSQAFAKPLVHMTHTTWGCVDPNIAPEMNDPENSRRSNPAWVAKARADGQCVMISSRSLWEPLSDSYNGLTYVAYRGTIGKPGSFWVPTSALEPAALSGLNPPPPPPIAHQPSVVARSAPAAAPSLTSQPVGDPSTVTAPPTVAKTPTVPEAVPTPAAAAPSSDTKSGSPAGAIAILLVLVVAGLLIRRSKKRRQAPSVGRQGPRKRSAASAGVETVKATSVPNVARPKVSVRPSPSKLGVTEGRGRGALQSPLSVIGRASGSEQERVDVWHGPGEAATIAGLTVRDGMVYLGQTSSRRDGLDASVIDPSLAVAADSSCAEALGYWPSYTGISAQCRRRYLEWLASGKQDPSADIGYVFIYFYGLERRLVLEEPGREEIRALLTELHRLRSVYAGNGSFDRYSFRLLDAANCLLDPAGSSTASVEPDFLAARSELPLALKVMIAQEVTQGRPLSFDHACAVLFALQEFSNEIRRVPENGWGAFMTVLRARFVAAFPDGYSVKTRKDAQLEVRYQGAAPGLDVDLTSRVGLQGLVDPTKLTWTRLLALGTAVTQEIAPYAMMMTHHPARANSLASLAICPPELRNAAAAEALNWLNGLATPVSAVHFGELAGHAIGTTTAKWSLRHLQHVSEALSVAGYALEPCPEEGALHLEDGTLVQVFRCDSDTRSRSMNVAKAASNFVAAVAKTVEGSDAVVSVRWLSAVPSRLALSPDQITRLRANLSWLATRDVTIPRAKRMLGDATADEREFCAWSAAEAAAATGNFGKPQVALLEAIYDALDVPRGALYAGLHAEIGTAAIDADEPVLVSEEVNEALHPIPPPPTTRLVPLDPERLARIRAETERTAAMLAKVFADDDAPRQAGAPVVQGRFPGLDVEHGALLGRLLARLEWSRADFDQAAADAGLMRDGAMETINEWAFDTYNEPLLEDGDSVTVNRALLPEDAETVPAE